MCHMDVCSIENELPRGSPEAISMSINMDNDFSKRT